ncbi:DUF4168 domain-containing protein [Pseudidiomarina terrestris]|uniref:DUF4168 domain-containing protein n=1 Tax=Pseudidiomarina terrestris TaxID=2820060 RepID=UPI0026506BC2|nr:MULTISPECIES: DUF4168 domain-containing protein [unclassified Pseudidiomarina]MDN7127918.1 DUF4168 domain-containing protein [Pseudidiomarina sp. 1APR75-33.1]MDN7135578.1 DUF4168 domain-containing protein [Pseudidiomarina sp. 1ASP75-5]MDN7137384.1 DUF4168 domain-containing protein [Pseudidiomarina sp. 1ASP75-14]MEA3589088.1 DUF4168 domain-containing protein [Pseudidiomarina sp. 1APP75-27a]
MKTLLPTLIASAIFATTAVTAAPMQQQSAQQGPAMQQQAQIEMTDALLEKFLAAMSDVQQVSQKYSQQFQNAENAEEAQAIQQKAQEEMIAAVNAAGLSPDEYNAVIQQVQQDPQLQKRLQEMTQ